MIGSYYQVSQDMYRTPAAALPGWQTSQVPGWGTNPMRAGPPRVGVGRAYGRTALGQEMGAGGTIGIVLVAIAFAAFTGYMGFIAGRNAGWEAAENF